MCFASAHLARAIQEIFDSIRPALEKAAVESRPADWVEREAPFIGEIYMGHLRYSTTGRSGLSYVHPFCDATTGRRATCCYVAIST